MLVKFLILCTLILFWRGADSPPPPSQIRTTVIMAACAQAATQQLALGFVKRSLVSRHSSSFLASRLSNLQANAAEASQQLRHSTSCRKDTAPIVNASSQPLPWGVQKAGGINRKAGLRTAAAGEGGIASYVGNESPEEESKRSMVRPIIQ